MLFLRMHDGIAVDLARRAMEKLRPVALRKLQAEENPLDRGHRREERPRLIMHRTRRTRQVVDLVEFSTTSQTPQTSQTSRTYFSHIRLDESEVLISRERFHVRPGARVEIVDRDNPVSFAQEPLAEMTAEKARTACH